MPKTIYRYFTEFSQFYLSFYTCTRSLSSLSLPLSISFFLSSNLQRLLQYKQQQQQRAMNVSSNDLEWIKVTHLLPVRGNTMIILSQISPRFLSPLTKKSYCKFFIQLHALVYFFTSSVLICSEQSALTFSCWMKKIGNVSKRFKTWASRVQSRKREVGPWAWRT